MLQLPVSPALGAKLLLLAHLRLNGDTEGHPFHGNQWVDGISLASATKEQVKKAVEMKLAGHAYSKIAAATGMTHKQASAIVYKVNKKQAEIKAQLQAKATSVVPTTMTPTAPKVDAPVYPSPYVSEIPDGQYAPAGYDSSTGEMTTDINSGYDIYQSIYNTKTGQAYEYDKEMGTYAKVGTPQPVGSNIPSTYVNPYLTTDKIAGITQDAAGNLTNAKGEKFTWQEKTKANSPNALPSNLGKFAYFNASGLQVSSAVAQGEHMKAAATMNGNSGPNGYVVPAAPAEKLGEVFKESAMVHSWPIADDVPRVAGANYTKQMQNLGHTWEGKLTAGEKTAVQHYTGSYYGSINSALRGNQAMSATIADHVKSIDSAIDKASKPPPPELVWRGIGSSGSSEFVKGLSAGDVIQMKGFQSTSINPDTAQDWGGGKTLFEIKPSKGAYVATVSGHPAEKEYLLPHNARYRVRGVTTIPMGANKYKRQVVQLEME